MLPCDSCTAPITVPIEGGEAHCPRCRTALLAPPRPDTTVPRSSSGDEAQRRERLRAQDGRPTLPPAGLEQMVSGGGVPAHKIQEATLIWAATRKQLASQPADVAAAERLVWLTTVLVNTLLASNDEAGIRALAEGALEVLMLPRHRQTMRTRLSRMAARAGDVDGAQKWLAGCDPASEDLEMDSAYRLSQAFVDTAQRNPDGVLAALGDSEQDVPIEDTMDALAAVLRANAWEQRGDVPRAKQLLARFMTSGGGLSNAVESIVAALPPQWQVCAQSMQSARSVVREQVGARAAGGTGGEMIGLVIMVAGCVPLLMLGVFAYQDQFQLPMLTMLLFPLLFGSWGLRMFRGARRAREIARDGLHGRGRILGASATGTRINGVPVMRLDVELEVEGHPRRKASSKRLLGMGQAQMLVGREVGVLWHPKYPDEVVLEM
ncbi:MAG TPA: hypothetical protein VG389_06260 [Myxococcota bacterium]|nr:hypothetical protein [Myxococcota bacterium]